MNLRQLEMHEYFITYHIKAAMVETRETDNTPTAGAKTLFGQDAKRNKQSTKHVLPTSMTSITLNECHGIRLNEVFFSGFVCLFVCFVFVCLFFVVVVFLH